MDHTVISDLRAIILDMDGVLVDTEPTHVQAFVLFMKELNLNFNEEDIHAFVGHSVEENIRTINRLWQPDPPLEIKQAARRRDDLYLQLLAERQLTPNPGIIDLIDFGINNHMALALASSSTREQINAILHNLHAHPDYELQLEGIFKTIVAGDEVTHKKPQPDIYARAVQHLRLRPEQCLAVEDSAAGVESAKRAGLYCVAIENRFNDRKKLQQADVVFAAAYDIVQWLFEHR